MVTPLMGRRRRGVCGRTRAHRCRWLHRSRSGTAIKQGVLTRGTHQRRCHCGTRGAPTRSTTGTRCAWPCARLTTQRRAGSPERDQRPLWRRLRRRLPIWARSMCACRPHWSHRVTELLAQVEMIEVKPDEPARVVIDEKSGTIVVGAEVKLDPVAITHGNLDRAGDRDAGGEPAGAILEWHAVWSRVPTSRSIHMRSVAFCMVPRSVTLRELVDGLECAWPWSARSDPGAERVEGIGRAARTARTSSRRPLPR